jgi:hypothetical protein
MLSIFLRIFGNLLFLKEFGGVHKKIHALRSTTGVCKHHKLIFFSKKEKEKRLLC